MAKTAGTLPNTPADLGENMIKLPNKVTLLGSTAASFRSWMEGLDSPQAHCPCLATLLSKEMDGSGAFGVKDCRWKNALPVYGAGLLACKGTLCGPIACEAKLIDRV